MVQGVLSRLKGEGWGVWPGEEQEGECAAPGSEVQAATRRRGWWDAGRRRGSGRGLMRPIAGVLFPLEVMLTRAEAMREYHSALE